MKFARYVMIAAILLPVSHAQAASIKVRSWCPMTGASGLGKGPTFDEAKDKAIDQCIDKGGYASCCKKFYRQI